MVARVKKLRGAGDPPHLPGGEFERSFVAPRLHLDHQESATPPFDGEKIDLAVGSAHVSPDHPRAGEPQHPGGEPLPTAAEGDAAVAGTGA